MIFSYVFSISLSSLAFEVLLARYFSISQWNHLSFMVISIALFGFAASGTFLNLFLTRTRLDAEKLAAPARFRALTVLYCVSAVTAVMVVNRLPLDYFRLSVEKIQAVYLMSAFFLFSIPFFFAGLIISLAYTAFYKRAGVIYLATMIGSAAGALLPFLLLTTFREIHLIVCVSLAPLLLLLQRGKGGIPPAHDHDRRRRIPGSAVTLFLTFAGGAAVAISAGILLTSGSGAKFSDFKALRQILRFPDSQIVGTRTDIRGRVDRVKSPFLRFAPGYSLKGRHDLPAQDAVYIDGDNAFTLFHLRDKDDVRFARSSLPFAGYLLVPEPRDILLIENGGGWGIIAAKAAGVAAPTVVTEHPHVAEMMASHYRIPVLSGNPRAYLRRSKKRFDLVQVENWGTSLPGSAALAQSYAFSVEAFVDYLDHLNDRGVLILSRKLLLPPADIVRLWGTAYRALKAGGIDRPENHLAVLRNWDIFTLICAKTALEDNTELERFARQMNFDIVYLPVTRNDMVNRFNRFAQPYHADEIRLLSSAFKSGEAAGYFESYLLDVASQTDDRPFPARFLKWTRIKDLYKSMGSRLQALTFSGEIVVFVVFVEGLLLSLLLLVAPLLLTGKKDKKPERSHVLYFLALGAGFMFLELYFIKSFTLLLGDPVVSLCVVLAGMMGSSGMGGYLSRDMPETRLGLFLGLLIGVMVCLYVGMAPIQKHVLIFPRGIRVVFAFLILIPTGVLAGLPFPVAMRCLLKNQTHRAYAWAANGCTSVLAAVASAQIAVSLGISLLLITASVAYLLALICVQKR